MGRPLPPRRPSGACARRERRSLPVCDRPSSRHLDAPQARPSPASVAPRLRDASPRGRRRPAHNPGAPRPLLALDDADLQPRRREAAAEGLRLGASKKLKVTPDVDSFLALSAARLAPRTVEAYRRDLSDF